MKLGELFVDLGVDSGSAFSTLSNFAFKFNNVAQMADKLVKGIENFGGSKAFASFSQDILNVSKELTVSTDKIQGLRRAANLMGTDWKTMTGKLRQFEKDRIGFFTQRNKSFFSDYARFGLTQADVVSLNSFDVMKKMIEVMKNISDERSKNAFIMDAGFDVQEFKAWEDYFKNQEAYDTHERNISREQLEASYDLNRSFDRLNQSLEDVGNDLKQKITPTVQKLTDKVVWFLNTGKIQEWVGEATSWVSKTWNKFTDWSVKDGIIQNTLGDWYEAMLHPYDTLKKSFEGILDETGTGKLIYEYNQLDLLDKAVAGSGSTVALAGTPAGAALGGGLVTNFLADAVTTGVLKTNDYLKGGNLHPLQFDPSNTKALKTKEELNLAQSTAYQFFKMRGIRPENIAAIMGNIMGESGFNPNALGDKGKSFGIAQWRDSRRTELESYAKEKGLPVNHLLTQLSFLFEEMQKKENGGFTVEKINRMTPEELVSEFVSKYERPDPKKRSEDIRKRTSYMRGIDVASLEDRAISNKNNNISITNNTNVEVRDSKEAQEVVKTSLETPVNMLPQFAL